MDSVTNQVVIPAQARMTTKVNLQKLSKLPSLEGFLALPESENREEKDSSVVVIPFGLENSVSYGKGTSRGPMAIINASHEVELFDESLWSEPYKKFNVTTLQNLEVPKHSGEALGYLEAVVSSVLDAKKFPLVLGGEHAITAGIINAFALRHKKLTILHFDAHADLRDGYQGNKFSHAAAMRRCLDNENVNLVSIGIRNISASEVPFLEANSHRIKIFWAKDRKTWDLRKILESLGNYPVYLTVDVDVFDSSLMPATGTPEPGGLFFDEVVEIIAAAAKTHKIVGADINELAPITNLPACDFLAAKLAYKILSHCVGA